MSVPTLVAVAHGTRDPAGPATVRALLDRVRALRPRLPVAEAYAELAEPSLEEAVRAARGPVVAVPLLLARGYHALIDIPGRACEAAGPRPVALARPLGPDALLGEALADRLAAACRAEGVAAGGPDGVDAVVLGAAGSSDPAGLADVRAAARLLTRRLGRPVAHGFVAAGGPALPDVVAGLRARGARRVAVASYLLAPGFFHDRITGAGADVVSAPLGAHDAVARLVLRRFDQARAGARDAGSRPVVAG
ncbi:sirohydrochlorin chelatase [Thermomonospora amylolytica]|uniref:sirohydrochlorin chelatase n=1 Tax=Thermomonospora amylolytica TaxID=1411117 RepID=UPI0018E53CEE|nr:sirohydrochlorin chelatase [Thermomonospora amylolytica]